MFEAVVKFVSGSYVGFRINLGGRRIGHCSVFSRCCVLQRGQDHLELAFYVGKTNIETLFGITLAPDNVLYLGPKLNYCDLDVLQRPREVGAGC